MSTETVPPIVMIVDDEPENLNVLNAMVRQEGWDVRAFPRADLALAAAREEPPALALLDIRMPGMDGYELCRRFKADDRLRQVPVIFISALSAMEDVAAGFGCGGVDYIAKPFREQEVLARARVHLELRRAYDELAGQHERLKRLEQHRDTLVHMLVHDLRSPLQNLLLRLEMIMAAGRRALDDATLDSLEAAIQCTRLLGRMASTAIDLSRMETGEGLILNPRPVGVRELFTAACAQSLVPGSKRPVTERIAAECPRLLCDAEVSARILANLLANAFKYSPRDGLVEVSAEPVADGVRIRVSDQGAPIPADQRQRIFRKFGTLDQPEDKAMPSTGLGLAFCKLAVEAQGGAIGVESEQGKGNAFWFTLPAAVSPLPEG